MATQIQCFKSCRTSMTARPRLAGSRISTAVARRASVRCRAAQTDVVDATTTTFPPPLPALDGNYESAVTFTSYANWLIPGSLMLGRYPFVEPSRCRTREEGEMQLQRILEAGITTFYSLQEEVPHQDDMRLSGVGGFLPYKGAAELLVTQMVGPPPHEVMNGLRNPHLDKFLPPRSKAPSETYVQYAKEYSREDLKFPHCPIVDLGVPTQQQMASLVSDVEQRLQGGEKLLVHCWGGRGRAGMLGACLLASLYGCSAEEALQRVQRAFNTRMDTKERSPETDEQHAFVRQFIASL